MGDIVVSDIVWKGSWLDGVGVRSAESLKDDIVPKRSYSSSDGVGVRSDGAMGGDLMLLGLLGGETGLLGGAKGRRKSLTPDSGENTSDFGTTDPAM